MSVHFEIVRTDADQPWHLRRRAANGELTFATENLTGKAAAEKNLLGLAADFWTEPALWTSPLDGKVYLIDRGAQHGRRVEVRYIDERLQVGQR